MKRFCIQRVSREEVAEREELAEQLLQEICNCLGAGNYSAAGVLCGLILNVLDFSAADTPAP